MYEVRFCAKCGNPLIEGARPKQVYVYHAQEPQINKKAIIISYIVTIILSWGGFFSGLISKFSPITMFTFFGFFMPFYLLQSKHPTIKKHGIIQFGISLVGVVLSFSVMFD